MTLVTPAAPTNSQAPSTSVVFQGVVIDAVTGQPVKGASIVGPLDAESRQQSHADSNGRFVLSVDNNLRTLDVLVLKLGYMTRTLTFAVDSQQRRQNAAIRLTPTGVISGRVLDLDGRPAVRVRVQSLLYQYEHGRPQWVNVGGTSSDDRGEFRILDLPAGQYVIAFSSDAELSPVRQTLYPGVPRISEATIETIQGGEETRLRDVLLGPSRFGEIRLHVHGSSEQRPADNVNLQFRSPGSVCRPVSVAGAHTNTTSVLVASGETVIIPYCPAFPGPVQIAVDWLTADGVRFKYVNVDFDGGDRNVDVDLVARRPPAGRVILEHPNGDLSPLANINVILRGASSNLTSVRTGKDGTFWNPDAVAFGFDEPYDLYDVEGLPGDSYVVSARQGDHNALTDGLLRAGDAILDIRVRPGGGALRGRVTDRQGRMVPDARVALLPATPLSSEARMPILYRTARTDENGSFTLSHLAPGVYVAYAWSQTRGEFAERIEGYLDPEFVKTYDGRGRIIKVGSGSVSIDMKLVDEPEF